MRFTELNAWLQWQQALHPRPIDPGLERIAEVYQRLGQPRPATVLTVGGTNGKGSVVAYLQAMLIHAGYEVGALTSPHLQRYNERITVRGKEVEDGLLMQAFDRIDAARGDISLTYFEWNTLAALLVFSIEHLQVAVLEVGMGGRLDAVNLLDADVAAVASVGLDHCEWLGSSLEEIGQEKAGIFRGGRTGIFGNRRMPNSIARFAADQGVRLRRLGLDFDYIERPDGWDYVGPGSKRHGLPLPALHGMSQLDNATTALAILEAAEPALLVPDGAVHLGLTQVSLPGRFQLMPGDPEWILDVAHNADAAHSLAASLRNRRALGRTIAVCGILADKDAAAIGRALSPGIDLWITVGLEGSRGSSGEALATRLALAPTSEIEVAVDVRAGCERASALAVAGDRVVVFGSFHTVGPALDYLGQGKPAPSSATI